MINAVLCFLIITASVHSTSIRRLLQNPVPEFPAGLPSFPTPGTPAPTPWGGIPVGLPSGQTTETPGQGNAATELLCHEQCTTSKTGGNCPSSCAYAMEVVKQPMDGFVMECAATGSCAFSQFTIQYPAYGPKRDFIETIALTAPYAGKGSTFVIDNKQTTTRVIVNTIECGRGACVGVTFAFKNADFSELICDGPCGSGCKVQVWPSEPKPCDWVKAI